MFLITALLELNNLRGDAKMNMSYCRFQNTKGDLEECAEKLNEMLENKETLDGLSKDEKRAAERLYNICQEYIDAFDNVLNIEPEDEEEESEIEV